MENHKLAMWKSNLDKLQTNVTTLENKIKNADNQSYKEFETFKQELEELKKTYQNLRNQVTTGNLVDELKRKRIKKNETDILKNVSDIIKRIDAAYNQKINGFDERIADVERQLNNEIEQISNFQNLINENSNFNEYSSWVNLAGVFNEFTSIVANVRNIPSFIDNESNRERINPLISRKRNDTIELIRSWNNFYNNIYNTNSNKLNELSSRDNLSPENRQEINNLINRNQDCILENNRIDLDTNLNRLNVNKLIELTNNINVLEETINNVREEEKTDEERVSKFREELDKFTNRADNFRTFLEESINNLREELTNEFVSDMINEFVKDYGALLELYNEEIIPILNRIANGNVTRKEIENDLRKAKEHLVELKNLQIQLYKENIASINENITAFRNESNLPENLIERIETLSLEVPSINDISRYDSEGYFRKLNYGKITDVLREFNEIRKLAGEHVEPTADNNSEVNPTEAESTVDSNTHEEPIRNNSTANKLEKFNNDLKKFKRNAELYYKFLNESRNYFNDVEVYDEIKVIIDTFVRGYAELFEKYTLNIQPNIERYSKDEITQDMIKEFNANFKDLKNQIKSLKNTQIEYYNNCVNGINKEINNLKLLLSEDNLSPDIRRDIENLEIMRLSTVTVGTYANYKTFTESLNHLKLRQTLDLMNQIHNRIQNNNNEHSVDAPDSVESMSNTPQVYDTLLNEINDIDKKVANLEEIISKIYSDNLNEIIDLAIKSRDTIQNSLLKFNTDITEYHNNNLITDEQFQNLQNRYSEVEKRFNKINENINTLSNNLSAELKINKGIESLHAKLDNFEESLKALIGAVSSEESLSKFKDIFNDINKSYEDLLKDIEKYKDVNKERYDHFVNESKKLQDKIKVVKELVDKIIVKKETVVHRGCCDIDQVEKDLNSLSALISQLEKPIKRSDRKIIDKQFDLLEDNINHFKRHLKYLKMNHPESVEIEEIEKFLERMADKDNQKSLENIRKEYRKKCPLYVRPLKVSKNKRKKMALIAAGLAAVAVVHATVGPVLIPAIMHGNMMMGYEFAPLRPLLRGINRILGDVINASVIDNSWVLANGVSITPAIAATTFLKGLAISGGASALLFAPVVIPLIKKIVEKAKKRKAKKEQELTDKKSKIVRLGSALKKGASKLNPKRLLKEKREFDENRINNLIEIYRISESDFLSVPGYDDEERKEALERIEAERKMTMAELRSRKGRI